ncbi:acetyl-CoA synthetase [Boothiomyces macroporosus]|uniref:Acetyl-coenzyme A synthetase n=1 Tax=Boothiomyces macroporosus TaxID=261099 RepID=A0AAD5Y1N5_9FUNG|nr:acetyl-CoA synthetase [Boothiomyces macroporosus]
MLEFEPPQFQGHAHHLTKETYEEMYKESIASPETFFDKMGKNLLHWHQPFTKVKAGGFHQGDVNWFHDGQLNVSYNCVDRHAIATPNKVAIIYEADEPGRAQKITYAELLRKVCQFANTLKKYHVKKGDRVAIYLPNIPEAAVAMLACARIGAIHSVIFAGFSSDAVRDRILDAECAVVITADQGMRGGKVTHLKKIVDAAIEQCPCVKTCIVFQRTGDKSVPFTPERDVWWHEVVDNQRPVCPPEMMKSEDPLFMLYTSGSTGKPKGVVHTQAGYLLGATMTCKYVFDMHPNDVHGCMADVGWITGHTYIVYGPLSNGVATVIFESVPTYPTPSRYWDLVDTHKVTQFYTAPTAIRALRRLGDKHLEGYKLDSIRVLGSVGEPINPEAWLWYHEVVGRKRCMIVDTYWQTETGSIVVTPIPGVTTTKPGSATKPFFGVELGVLDSQTGQELVGNDVEGVLVIKSPFPSIARTVYDNHKRYMDTYLKPYPGFYFAGDGVKRDKDGYYWIQGRVDDVINVSGHRMSTAEVESALILHPLCGEAAVVGVPDDISGEAIVCFCSVKSGYSDITELQQSLRAQVRQNIGPFATPKRVIIVPDLPKTRSGKIMRRILRKVAAKDVTLEDAKTDAGIREKLGDISTLADQSIVKILIETAAKQ